MLRFFKKFDTDTDEQLMQHMQRGETAAFDVLYQRYSKRLLYYFYRMLGGNGEKAQDFLQDLFLKIVENPDRFCAEHRFSSWIFTVAHNMCKNEYRRQEVRQIIINTPDIDLLSTCNDDDHPIETALDHQAFQEAVFNELATLDPCHRTTFLLRHQENYSIQEISDAHSRLSSRLWHGRCAFCLYGHRTHAINQ